jgi:hypothetical protein
VHLQTRSITVSKLARLRPPSVSPLSLDHGIQVPTIMASKCIYTLARSLPPSASPNSLDPSLQFHLQNRSIAASKCICKLTRLQPPKCISNLARLRPSSSSPNSLDHGLQIASPNSLNHGPGVYPSVHLIVIFRVTLNCSQAPPGASPDISCVDG